MGNNFTANLALLESRLSAARAGYLDNLSGGAVALASVMSATRGGYLDNLSAGAVALDSKMDIVDTNVDTLLVRLSATRAGYLDNLDQPFESIAVGAITIAGSSNYGDATITAVDTAKTLLVMNGFSSAATGMAGNDDTATIILLNSTTVRAARQASPATALYVNFTLLEWK